MTDTNKKIITSIFKFKNQYKLWPHIFLCAIAQSFSKESYENVVNELYYLHKISFNEMSHNIPSEACGYLICMDRWEN